MTIIEEKNTIQMKTMQIIEINRNANDAVRARGSGSFYTLTDLISNEHFGEVSEQVSRKGKIHNFKRCPRELLLS